MRKQILKIAVATVLMALLACGIVLTAMASTTNTSIGTFSKDRYSLPETVTTTRDLTETLGYAGSTSTKYWEDGKEFALEFTLNVNDTMTSFGIRLRNTLRTDAGNRADVINIGSTGTITPVGTYLTPIGDSPASISMDNGWHRIGVRYKQEAVIASEENPGQSYTVTNEAGTAVTKSDVCYIITFTIMVDGAEVGTYAGNAQQFLNKGWLLYGAIVTEATEDTPASISCSTTCPINLNATASKNWSTSAKNGNPYWQFYTLGFNYTLSSGDKYTGSNTVTKYSQFNLTVKNGVVSSGSGWMTNVVPIDYNLNGGEWGADNVTTETVTNGNMESYDLYNVEHFYTVGTGVAALPTPVRAHYRFTGWYDNAECTGTPVTSISAEATDAVTLYAGWEQTSGTVNYVTMGGTIGDVEYSEFYEYSTEATLTLPSSVTLSGYEFLGWYTDLNYTNKVNGNSYALSFEESKNNSITFYARYGGSKVMINNDLTSGNFYWKKNTDGTANNGTVTIAEDGSFVWTKTEGGAAADNYLQKAIRSYTGTLYIEFTISSDDPIDGRLRLRASDSSKDTNLFNVGHNGLMHIGGTQIGTLTSTPVTVGLAVTFVENGVSIDAYVDNVMVVNDVLVKSSLKMYADSTANCVARINWYNNGNANGVSNTGTMVFTRFYVSDGGDFAITEPSGDVSLIFANTTLPAGVATTAGTLLPTIENVPTTPGYSFAGWYDNAELEGDPITSVTANGAPITVYAKYEGNYNATYKANGATVDSAEKVCDITLPTTYAYWIDGTGAILAGGSEVSLTANTTFTALTVDLLEGASVRLDTPTGLRFETAINEAMIALLKQNEGAVVEIGTLIVPTDTLGASIFTAEALDAAGVAYVSMKSYLGGVEAADGVYTVYASLTNVLAKNYTRNFSAISYIKVTINDVAYTVYDSYTEEDNARSIYEVALAALNSEDAYSADEITLLKSFVDKVAALDAETLAVSNTSAKYTSPYVASYEDGVLTVSRTDGAPITAENLSTVLIGDVAYTGGWTLLDGKLTASYTLPEAAE